jgi:hypothetical protein
MNNLIKSKLVFKYKDYAIFSKSQTWAKLKIDLEKIKEREAMGEAEAATEFEAVKRDIKRSQTIRIINEIINIVERAESKINKF